MAANTEKLIELYEMLPEKDQAFAYELVKKLVLAWDPDFTKLTPKEAAAYDEALKGELINEEDINWNEIGI